MGLLDNLRGLLAGSGRTTAPVELTPGEFETARTYGQLVGANALKSVGGELILTNQRLIFTPWNITDLAPLLAFGLKRAGVAGAGVVVGWVAGQVRGDAADLTSITGATPGRDAALLHPPTLVVQLADGRRLEFGIVVAKLSPNRSLANNDARDVFLAKLRTSAS